MHQFNWTDPLPLSDSERLVASDHKAVLSGQLVYEGVIVRRYMDGAWSAQVIRFDDEGIAGDEYYLSDLKYATLDYKYYTCLVQVLYGYDSERLVEKGLISFDEKPHFEKLVAAEQEGMLRQEFRGLLNRMNNIDPDKLAELIGEVYANQRQHITDLVEEMSDLREKLFELQEKEDDDESLQIYGKDI